MTGSILSMKKMYFFVLQKQTHTFPGIKREEAQVYSFSHVLKQDGTTFHNQQ